MEAVHADWKEYLNLLICEENHLKHMDEYHKVSANSSGGSFYMCEMIVKMNNIVKKIINTFPVCWKMINSYVMSDGISLVFKFLFCVIGANWLQLGRDT